MRRSKKTPTHEQVPMMEKLLFSSGNITVYLAVTLVINILWMPFFNIGMGINPVTLGIILMVLRGWDAITDPIIGNLSDNIRTKWGRRKPLIFIGAILTGAVFPFLFNIPGGLSETGLIIYLILIGILFFTFFTTWSMPYYSLQMELTPNYDERTRVAAWMTLFGKLGSMTGGWALAIFAGPWFINQLTGEPDLVTGIKTCSWFIGLMIMAIGILPALFVRERYYEADISNKTKEPFWKSMKESATCAPLWGLIAVSFFIVLGTTSTAGLNQYVNIYFISHGDVGAAAIILGWRQTILVIMGIALLPVWTWLGERYDKKNMVIAMLLFSVFGHLLNLICLRADMPYLQLIPALFESAAISSIWLYIPSMKADVADYDELQTTQRREGSLNSFYSWFIKASATMAMGLGGVVLQLTGFDATVKAQANGVVDRMFLYYIILPIAMWGIGIACIVLYPLNRKSSSIIRQQLEERRGAI